MTARPRPQRKHDRIAFGGKTTPTEIAIDHAIAPFDRLAREMEKTWGIDGLVARVSPQMAASFGKAVTMLNEALDAQDIDRAVDRASNAMRGLVAMDAEARRLGHTPPDPIVVETQVGDHHFGILVDGGLWERAQEQRPNLKLYTLREVSVALKMLEQPLIDSVKASFPGAEVIGFKPRRAVEHDDLIPFGDEEDVPF